VLQSVFAKCHYASQKYVDFVMFVNSIGNKTQENGTGMVLCL